MAKLTASALALALVLLGLVSSVPAEDPVEDALGAGDECGSSGAGGCALSALQRSGQRLATEEAAPAESAENAKEWEDEVPTDDLEPFALEPDAKEYTNISLQGLGSDELERLVAGAGEVLAGRLGERPEPAALAESDEGASCSYRQFRGRAGSSEQCFCQLAGNRGCQGQRCACPQGCNVRQVAWVSSQTVTFKNKARAVGCSPSAVLLTATSSFYRDISDLKKSCGGGAVAMLAQVLRNGFDMYHSHVGPGPVNQCFHSPRIASVKYLHLQTFCHHGSFHSMPTGNRKNGIGACVTMSSRGQAGSLAAKLLSWY